MSKIPRSRTKRATPGAKANTKASATRRRTTTAPPSVRVALPARPLYGQDIDPCSTSPAAVLAPCTTVPVANVLVDAFTTFTTEVTAKVFEMRDGAPIPMRDPTSGDAVEHPEGHDFTTYTVRISEGEPGELGESDIDRRFFSLRIGAADVVLTRGLKPDSRPWSMFDTLVTVREIAALYAALDAARDRMRAAGFLL